MYDLVYEAELVIPPSQTWQIRTWTRLLYKLAPRSIFASARDLSWIQHTEDLVARVVLPNEVAEKHLVDVGPIIHLQ